MEPAAEVTSADASTVAAAAGAGDDVPLEQVDAA